MLGSLNLKPHLHCHHCLLTQLSSTWCSSSGRKLQPGSALALSPVSPLLVFVPNPLELEGGDRDSSSATVSPEKGSAHFWLRAALNCPNSVLGLFSLTLHT